jgi:hypothetical protein
MKVSDLRAAARYARQHGAIDLADELSRVAAELEQDADRRPGDFADDGCGDPTLSLVPGWAC